MKRMLLWLLIANVFAPGLATGQDAPSAPTGAGEILRLSLDEAIRLALSQGTDALLARQDVAIAQAQKGIVLSNALTSIFLETAYNRNVKRPVIFFPDEEGKTQSFELGEDNEYRATLSLRQPLFSSGRLGAARRASQERAWAARLRADAEAARIAFEVKSAYFQALLAQEQTAIAELSLEQARGHLDRVRSRVERGLASRLDRLRAEVEVAGRKPLLTRARHQQRLAVESLNDLIGIEVTRPVVLTDTLGYREPLAALEEALAVTLERRPELAAARREVEAAQEQFRAQSNNDLPLLYLDGNYVWQGQTSDRIFPEDQETAQSVAVGLTFNWPILDGLRNRYESRQSWAALQKARLQLRRLERAAMLEARSTWQELETARDELRGREEAAALAQEAYRIAQLRYDNGLSTQIEVLDAEVALTQARLTRLEALYRYNVAQARLEVVLGRGPTLDMAGGTS